MQFTSSSWPPTSTMEYTASEDRAESSRANYETQIIGLMTKEAERKIMQVTKYSEKLREEGERRSTSCIFRVLPRLKNINGSSLYEPNMVSIGPYYYKQRDEKFQMGEDCKRKCFGALLLRALNLNPNLATKIYMSCLQKISDREADIRKCYSEEVEVSGTDFVEMMVVDACFILEIIEMFRYRNTAEASSNKSLAALEWMVPYFYRDFLLLENQIPFFVLDEIYGIISEVPLRSGRRNDLIYAALEFFKNGMKRFDLDIFDFTLMNAAEMNQSLPLHLLDLVRSSFKPSAIRMRRGEFQLSVKNDPFIHCISKLKLAGITVSRVKKRSFLEVRFKKGVIEMPSIAIDEFMRCLLLNCVAFEQCHNISGYYFTAYATFLDCLVNTEEDVEYLRERNVIDNYLADDFELVGFINRAGKDLVLNDYQGFYLRKLFEDVEEHYQNWWMWKWASFKREYLDKWWLLPSAVGGILLVLATLFQAVIAFLTYKYKSS